MNDVAANGELMAHEHRQGTGLDDGARARMVELAISRLPQAELVELIKLADKAMRENARYSANADFLGWVKNGHFSTAFNTLALLLNRSWRNASSTPGVVARTKYVKELAALHEKLAGALHTRANGVPQLPENAASQPSALTVEAAIVKVYELNLGRTPAPAEIEIWNTNLANGLPFHEFLLLIAHSPEAQSRAGTADIAQQKSDGAFIQTAYEIVHGRGCSGWEIDHWVSRIVSGKMKRSEVLAAIFSDATTYQESLSINAVHDGLSCHIMGTGKLVTVDDWKKKASELKEHPAPTAENRYKHRFHIKGGPRYLVSAIASLYRGGDFIEQFMDNITSQTCFDDYCELVIVDADSPENEYETIKRYLAKHKGIHYLRMNYRIGIYDAWNVGAKAARGEYLTNTNMDDLRRKDSLELQAATLDNLPFVDVVYQDLYYTFDPRLSFEEIAAFDYKTNLPVITPYNMMQYNSPHNAPMWRKALHDELGYFNTHYKSAGDYEFWMRCLAAGKTFYKINDPHVVYYQNPNGLSTRPDTRGVVEAREIMKTYARKLVSENLVLPFEQFCRNKLPGVPAALDAGKHDRHALAQGALRNAARSGKYSKKGRVH